MVASKNIYSLQDYLNADTKGLYGARFSDDFKFHHKSELPGHAYACDLDLVLLSKYPPGVVAYLDFKFPNEPLTFTEVLLYNICATIAPVFLILSTSPKTGPFTVRRYLHGDWRPDPPTAEFYDKTSRVSDWQSFGEWEQALRNEYQKRSGWGQSLAARAGSPKAAGG